MAGPFLSKEPKKQDQIIAIDLGGRTTKAVHIQRKGETFAFNRFAVLDAPIFEKSLSVDLLADHLKAVMQALDTRNRQVILGLGANDSLLRQAEVPVMPVGDLRMMLKINSKNYLQQDLPDYLFDAFILAQKSPDAAAPEKTKASLQKQRVLVGGAKRMVVEDLQSAAKSAGLIATAITPTLVAPANAFEMAMPEVFQKESVALVDLGFKSSTITILQEGNIVLNRVLSGGGDKLTNGLAESLGISYAEADGIKVKLISEVENNLEPVLSPLGRELRASLDFYEHQQDRQVSQVYFSGGSARAEFIIRTLQNSLMIPCQSWNPASFMQLNLPPEQLGDLEQCGPLLTVAIGLAATAF